MRKLLDQGKSAKILHDLAAGLRGWLQVEHPLKDLEEHYRLYYLKEDASLMALFLSIGAASYLYFLRTDHALFGWQLQFFQLLLIRIGFFLLCLWTGVRLFKVASPQQYDRLVTGVGAATIISTLYINTTRPAEYAGNLPLDVLIVLAIYLIPLRFSSKLLLCLVFSIGDALIMANKPLMIAVYSNLFFAFVLINLFGVIISGRFYTQRRLQFKMQMELEKINQEMTVLAMTDGLTEISNRRSFIQESMAEFERARRYQRPLTVAILDIDRFKDVNDTHGHAIGDQVLRQVVKMIEQQKRCTDILGRLGGEEFGLLLPETNLKDAVRMAERLCALFQEHALATEVGPVQVTVSIGLAEISENDLTFDVLQVRADRKLYEAKQTGRSRWAA